MLDDRILQSQGEMNGRGMLQSSIAVKSLHDIFADEFLASRQTIVSTVADSLRTGTVRLDRDDLEVWALTQLRQRQVFLDGYFRERGQASIGSLQNQAMNAPFMNVAQYLDHASQELRIEIKAAIDTYENSLGATLYDRVLNKFKNHPVVVIGSVTVFVLLAIFGLYSAIRQI